MSELEKTKRILKVDLPKGRSAFLWGPRKVGKTTLLRQQFASCISYDLLQTDIFLRLAKEPFRLRQELLALGSDQRLTQPIIIDEIQKIPHLLDEIHWLIENRALSFILCGSSARKLKRSHANMLGGRAWRFELFPLTTQELGSHFDLLKALNRGLVPAHYFDEDFDTTLKSYIHDYLKEEIQSEGLVRNLPAFARFLDAVSFSNGEMVNFSNIARDCGVDAKTVSQYYQILSDTLLGYFLEPFHTRKSRNTIFTTPKFYLFDVGVASGLSKRTLQSYQGFEFGRAFEHFIFMELLAYRSYSKKDVPICYWRTKTQQEVDFIIGPAEVAIEVKSTTNVDAKDTTGLRSFIDMHAPQKSYVICQESVARQLPSGITVLPWQIFCSKLWAGEIF